MLQKISSILYIPKQYLTFPSNITSLLSSLAVLKPFGYWLSDLTVQVTGQLSLLMVRTVRWIICILLIVIFATDLILSWRNMICHREPCWCFRISFWVFLDKKKNDFTTEPLEQISFLPKRRESVTSECFMIPKCYAMHFMKLSVHNV